MNKILMIDDSLAFCESVIDLIEDEQEDWQVEYALGGIEGINLLMSNEYDVVLLDLKMPGMSGLEVLTNLDERKIIYRNYIIVLTGEITIENAVSSLQYGARDFVQKPLVAEFPEMFLKRIEKGYAWQAERSYNEELKKEKKKAILESQLIVKSIGHDMSGSYYGSVMLRLQMLRKKILKISTYIDDHLLDYIKDCPEAETDVKKAIKKINDLAKNAAHRSESIIELMGFFKELGEKLKHLGAAISIDDNRHKTVCLSSILQAAVSIFSDSMVTKLPNIKIVKKYAPQALPITASEEDLIRVFINLIENAYKAMAGTGTLYIKTLTKNNKAVAIIQDTGCGIPEEDLEKIWRPDFTRWAGQTGTGLGLLICRKAVENSGGIIKVESEVGQGTTFTLIFNMIKK